MAVLSLFSRLKSSSNKLGAYFEFARKHFLTNGKNALQSSVRNMSEHGPRTMYITPSRFMFRKFKDDLHFYTALGVIPLGLLILYVNIFIGQAELAEIPEGYEPEYWEYYRHPISRFIIRNFQTSHQENYEKCMHSLNEQMEKQEAKRLLKKVKKLQRERDDYRGWYYHPNIQGKPFRQARKEADKLEEMYGYY